MKISNASQENQIHYLSLCCQFHSLAFINISGEVNTAKRRKPNQFFFMFETIDFYSSCHFLCYNRRRFDIDVYEMRLHQSFHVVKCLVVRYIVWKYTQNHSLRLTETCFKRKTSFEFLLKVKKLEIKVFQVLTAYLAGNLNKNQIVCFRRRISEWVSERVTVSLL